MRSYFNPHYSSQLIVDLDCSKQKLKEKKHYDQISHSQVGLASLGIYTNTFNYLVIFIGSLHSLDKNTIFCPSLFFPQFFDGCFLRTNILVDKKFKIYCHTNFQSKVLTFPLCF